VVLKQQVIFRTWPQPDMPNNLKATIYKLFVHITLPTNDNIVQIKFGR